MSQYIFVITRCYLLTAGLYTCISHIYIYEYHCVCFKNVIVKRKEFLPKSKQNKILSVQIHNVYMPQNV